MACRGTALPLPFFSWYHYAAFRVISKRRKVKKEKGRKGGRKGLRYEKK
jgi:hypothetical protein